MITKVLLKNQITNSILKTLIKDTVPYFHREPFSRWWTRLYSLENHHRDF